MTKRPSAIADIDISAEGLAQQDGLAERLQRRRGARVEGETQEGGRVEKAPSSEFPRRSTRRSDERDANAWRQGKGLLQVAVDEDAHVELSIIAKRRRMTLSRLVKDALTLWLEKHGYVLEID